MADSRRMIAFFRAIRWAPNPRVIVTIAGRPSGTIATAREIAARRVSTNGFPRSSPIMKIARAAKIPIKMIVPPRRFRSFWSGAASCFTPEKLAHRGGFPGERGLVGREINGLEKPSIGGDFLSHTQEENVTGNQLL